MTVRIKLLSKKEENADLANPNQNICPADSKLQHQVKWES